MTEKHSKRRAWMAAAGVTTALALGVGGAAIVSAQGTTVTPGPVSAFSSNTTPVRVLDTRSGVGQTGGVGVKLGPGQRITVDMTAVLAPYGAQSPPVTPNAVVVNVGVENPTVKSYVALLPAGAAAGTTSSVNFDVGQTTANQAIVALVDGKFDVYNSVGTTEVFIDLLGVYGVINPT
jgi:hypothetical protein